MELQNNQDNSQVTPPGEEIIQTWNLTAKLTAAMIITLELARPKFIELSIHHIRIYDDFVKRYPATDPVFRAGFKPIDCYKKICQIIGCESEFD